MSKIIVAGAGIGGLLAAIRIAQAGHSVTLVEKGSRETCSADQKDFLDIKAMEYSGLPVLEHYRTKSNVITFVPADEDVPPVTLPAREGMESLCLERREFIERLFTLAEEAGVRLIFGCEITGPVMLGNRVAGVETGSGEFYGDLVIDACGVNSPVRGGLPGFTCVENKPAVYDVLHTYRAYFDRVPGVPDPGNLYNLYIKDDGTVGLTWLVTEQDCVDVLIARFHESGYNDVASALNRIYEDNPHMGRRLIRGGQFRDIPVRAPLAVLVADGYAAVGDSAFMTYAVKGSGIGYSLMAGRMLADAVLSDESGFYTAEALWPYQRNFFREIGFSACRIAMAKNLLPYLTAGEVSDIFRCGLVSTEEMADIMSGGPESVLKGNPVSLIKEKLHLLGENPGVRAKLLSLAGWVGRFAVVEPFLPGKYSAEDVRRWAEKYNEFFDSIRRKDEEPPEV